ncbi:toprim domain-containing protein [Pararhodospirillum photometricum]|uniref:Probable phage-related protein n=1 Tax=Pararhodospirillum photometricum DSM 122 TaxID=1150469 RepID=H6SNX7_PARPM|nr:toprim domain-containing protein [Pararhodospirillum photometricum]CCG07049.1 Probable phage-related protein [Pararhodospirillum photometricum DSM 122]
MTTEMRDDVRAEVVARLKTDYKMQAEGEWLRKGVCPGCGHKELYVNALAPWVVRCGRLNRCGWSAPTKELFPDAFGRFNERFPATSERPNATAEAYLDFVRGLSPLAVAGCYRQGSFAHPRGDRRTATVLFDVAPGVWMERLIDVVRITGDDGEVEERRAHFHGSFQGLWWAPPDLTLTPGDTLWLAEGCIDALSLRKAGLKAVATLSCSNYPSKSLASLPPGVTLVWALDNDKAGLSAIRKHVARAKADGWTCEAALVPQKGRRKTDWNDLLLAEGLDEKGLDDARHQGALLLAESPLEKGLLVWRRRPSSGFAVEHGRKTWWWSLSADELQAMTTILVANGQEEDEAKIEAARSCAKVKEIINCEVRFLYFQKRESTDESWYYAAVLQGDERKNRKLTFTGPQLATASEFKKRLLSANGAVYSGVTDHLNWILQHSLRDVATVETIDFIGYSNEHQTYIFPDLAVHKGKVIPINEEDFFEIGRNIYLKTLSGAVSLNIGRRADYRPEWTDLLYRAFGAKGLVATAFFLGSLFAEQIRGLHKSFPFLEIVGEAGSGKSTLIEFLWKLMGRDSYEGFDPNKATLAARARIFSQVSNLPVSLIESDRDGKEDGLRQRQFDWDELKTAYNGRASRARGVRNGGNDTYEPPFKGAILISQNAPVNASEAILQRIVHLYYSCGTHTRDSKEAAAALGSLPVEAVSHFLILATTAEAQVMATVKARTVVHEAALLARPDVRSNRLAKNHAQIMALVEALGTLVGLPESWVAETLDTLSVATAERQQAVASDHPVVEEFWELLDWLGLSMVNHSRDPGLLAINLNMVVELAGRSSQAMPPLIDLKRHLKGSRTRRFIAIKTVNSCLDDFVDKRVKCWVFEKGVPS